MSSGSVYLVPGFFGFSELGGFNYFYRVAETLQRELRARGYRAQIVECTTLPTGSITARAERLLQHVIASGGLDGDEIHFVGHSTGGLDVRLLLTPGVVLRKSDEEERVGARTRSATMVATPHFGTPLAGFFTSAQGRTVLRLLTTLASSEPGRATIFASSQLLQAISRFDDRFGWNATLLDIVARRLLSHVTLDPNDPIWSYIREVGADQGAIIQLTPEGMNLFNAAVIDRPGVRYASVVVAAPRPSLSELARYRSLKHTVLYGVFALLHAIAAREHLHYPYPWPIEQHLRQLVASLPFEPTSETNDGIVPTLSQIHGEILDTQLADHLDVVGQFYNAGGRPLSDWLPSGSHFDEAKFVAVWSRIADFICRESALFSQLPA